MVLQAFDVTSAAREDRVDSSGRDPRPAPEATARGASEPSTHGRPGAPEIDVVTLPRFAALQPRAAGRFELLQQFECTVLEIRGDEFDAQLADRTAPSNPDEVATFSLSELSDDDRSLARDGAVFYWTIGYRVQPWGTRERASSLRFRRIPGWTQGDLESAERQADEWAYMLGGHEPR